MSYYINDNGNDCPICGEELKFYSYKIICDKLNKYGDAHYVCIMDSHNSSFIDEEIFDVGPHWVFRSGNKTKIDINRSTYLDFKTIEIPRVLSFEELTEEYINNLILLL